MTITYKDGTTTTCQEEFDVPASWFGKLLGTYVIPLEKLEIGITEVHIDSGVE